MKSSKRLVTEIDAGPGAARSKADHAYEVIRQRILDRRTAPGDRLVIEHLAREIDVSVVPVREAIRRLEAEGYVTYTRNVGATVTSIDLDRYPETVEALAVLEGVAIGLAAPHLTAKDIKTARDLNEKLRRSVDALDPPRFTATNQAFHKVLYQRCPNRHILQPGRARVGAARDHTAFGVRVHPRARHRQRRRARASAAAHRERPTGRRDRGLRPRPPHADGALAAAAPRRRHVRRSRSGQVGNVRFRSDPSSIRGSIAPVVTPFTAAGEVDHDGLRALVQWQLASGSHGISIGGSTGEPSAQTVAERIAAMRIVAEEVADRVPFMPGTGSAKLDETLELTEAAISLGADAALVITPYYSRPTQEGSVRVVLGGGHGRFPTCRSCCTTCRSARPSTSRPRRLPVCAATTTTWSASRRPPRTSSTSRGSSTCAGATRSCGRASSCCAFRCWPSAASASSARSPTWPPARSPRCTTTGSSGETEKALDIHYGLHPLVDLMFVETNPAPIKSVLARAGHIASDHVRPPLVSPTTGGLRRIDALLVEGAPMLEGPLAALAASLEDFLMTAVSQADRPAASSTESLPTAHSPLHQRRTRRQRRRRDDRGQRPGHPRAVLHAGCGRRGRRRPRRRVGPTCLRPQ